MFKAKFAILLLLIPALAFGSEPFAIISGSGEQSPQQPQACIDRQGIVHLTYGMGDAVYYCKIEASEKPLPRLAFRIPNMSLGMRRGPRIAHAGDAIVITAIGGEKGKGADGDAVAYRSLDAGESWIGPVKINDIEASAREGLHAMAANEDGTLWCVWLDLRTKRTQLFVSKSLDQGASWSKNQLVYKSPDGSICECCHPSVLAHGNEIHILFRNSLNGNRDMYLISSRDGGNRFEEAVRLGESNWKLNACPMDGGMLALDKDAHLSTVWRRDRSIFSTATEFKAEIFVGMGEQPWIANNGKGAVVVWTSRRDGELFLWKPDGTTAMILDRHASYPIAVAAMDRKSSVYLFWESRDDKSNSILGQRID